MELNQKETSTILAALRMWQRVCWTGNVPAELLEVANECEGPPLTRDDIDALCERLNMDATLRTDDCPSCHNGEVEGGFIEVDSTGATQVCYCCECNAEWVLGFTLSHITMVRDGKLDDA